MELWIILWADFFPLQISVADSQFIDQRASAEKDFSSADPLARSAAEVGEEVTAAPPPLSIVGNTEEVAVRKEAAPPEKKGTSPYCTSMYLGKCLSAYVKELFWHVVLLVRTIGVEGEFHLAFGYIEI